MKPFIMAQSFPVTQHGFLCFCRITLSTADSCNSHYIKQSFPFSYSHLYPMKLHHILFTTTHLIFLASSQHILIHSLPCPEEKKKKLAVAVKYTLSILFILPSGTDTLNNHFYFVPCTCSGASIYPSIILETGFQGSGINNRRLV